MISSNKFWHISFSDLIAIAKENKKRFLLIFLFLYGAGFCYIVQKPVGYTAKALFKAPIATTGLLPKSMELLSGSGKDANSTDDTNAFELLKSYGVLSKVALKLHLQGYICEKKGQPDLLKRVWDNLRLESHVLSLAMSKNPPSSILPKQVRPSGHLFQIYEEPILTFSQLNYDEEVYSLFSVTFTDELHYTVLDAKKRVVGEGTLDRLFSFPQGSFTIKKTKSASLASRSFTLSLIPLRSVVSALKQSIKVKKDKFKPAFLQFSFANSDRHLAASIVNATMESYQLFVMERAKEKISLQLHYLSERKKEMLKELESVMHEHQRYLKDHVHQGGFLQFEKEASFMMERQAKYISELSQIKLQIVRLGETLFDDSLDFPSLLAKLNSEKEHLILETKEYQPLTLTSAEDIFFNYLKELDRIEFQKRLYLDCLEKLADPQCEIGSLIQILKDPLLTPLFEQVQLINARLQDTINWSEKEREVFKETLQTKKKVLEQELHHLINGRGVERQIMVKKIADMQKALLVLLSDEYAKIQEALNELSLKEATLPEKWLEEKKIDLNLQMASSFVEHISRAIEERNITYNMASVNSYPVEFAFPPTLPHSPKLFVRPLLLAFLGLIFYAAFLLLKYLKTGPRVPFTNFEMAGRSVLGAMDSQRELAETAGRR